MEKFFNNKDTCDVKFVFEDDDRILYANKIILSKNSEIFYKIFYDKKWIDNNNKTIKIEGFGYDDFFIFCEFVYNPKKYQYTGIVNSDETDNTEISIQLTQRLYEFQIIEKLSNFYQNSCINTQVKEYVQNYLNTKIVSLLLNEDQNSKFIKNSCLEYLARNIINISDGQINENVKSIVLKLSAKNMTRFIKRSDIQLSKVLLESLIDTWCIITNNHIDISTINPTEYIYKYSDNKITKTNINICAICRSSLIDNCLYCTQDNTCLFISGICGHDYHSHCINSWLKHRNICPICSSPWMPISRPQKSIVLKKLFKNK